MASELELLLQAYGGQGEYDSTGSFTVDPEKLREKLSRFLLPEPHAYILKLVQWAVAAGARRIKVEVGRRRLIFAHDGRFTDEAAAADWGFFLESNWQAEGFRSPEVELACALNSLYQLSPEKIVLLQRNRDRAVLLEVDHEGSKRSEAPNKIGSAVNLIKIDGRRLAFGSPLAAQQYRNGLQPAFAQALKFFTNNIPLAEKALLEACCGYCPIALQLNGRCINRPVFELTEPGRPLFNRVRNPFSLKFIGVRNLTNHAFAYHLAPSNLELLGPTHHPGASVSSWYCPEAADSVIESRSDNDFPVRGLLNWTLNSKISIEGSNPVNILAGTVYQPRVLSRTALVSGVVRGVCIETDTDGFLPADTFTVLSNTSLGTDLSGLRVRKSHERTQFLRTWSEQVQTILQRRRKV
ncbi:MAG: hypothetical protein KC800_20710 [Candidatus Eremiobacteraeota bacterium]|nr:hypothetical protein [Candidatus Eremiobacteraeota bacterium]